MEDAFLERNPTIAEETTSITVCEEEEHSNVSMSSASLQVPVEVQESSLADNPVTT